MNNFNSQLSCRITIKSIKEQDKQSSFPFDGKKTEPAGTLKQSQNYLRVVDLYSGAGGMSLGFLMAGNLNYGFKIIQASEINPVYIKSLERNFQYFTKHSKNSFSDCCPTKINSTDLTTISGYNLVKQSINYAGGIDILIGGPPCQGFSTANSRKTEATDKLSNKLIDIFINCAIKFSPKVILLENVQGILWSHYKKNSSQELKLVDYISKSLNKAGYFLFPKILDSAWYGVPQHRNRFFLLGLHKSLGYLPNDFGEWGPFPFPTHGPLGKQPYVTVNDAIVDLPPVKNGENTLIQEYKEPSKGELNLNPFLRQMREMSPKKTIEGHIVSKQADYVIERYRRIPQGGNWRSIQELMNNYTDTSKTHSNIYRRLEWNKPSITISHYRKSMIIHPKQHRGLSLREATRLQSLPDWFTFCGTEDCSEQGGIGHKQQQVANAVSFFLTVAMAKYILEL